MEKKTYKIYIEEKEGILKKLDSNITLKTLRDKLKNYQIENLSFVGNDNLFIEKDDEEDFTIDEILVNGKIYLKSKKNKILILLNNIILDEVENSNKNILLSDFRKLSKNIKNEYHFVTSDGFKIEIDDENQITIKDVLENNIVKMEVKNNTLDICNEKDNKKKISENKIKLIITITEEDINQKIYFLSEKYLNDLNDSNIDLFINEKKYKFNKYFIPEKEGIYTIIIKLNKNIIKDCSNLFKSCKKITNIDLSSFDSKDVINMEFMFSGCYNVTNINLSNFNTENVINMGDLFNHCENLKNIDLSSFDTRKVTNMKNMFFHCINLETINISSFNTKNVTSMYGFFMECKKLKNIDVSSFDTKNVTNMEWMFSDCESLLNIDVSSFNTIKVTNMREMFYGCRNLIDLDLSNFNTVNVMYFNDMFYRCYNLIDLDVSNFVFQSKCDISGMFNSNVDQPTRIKVNKSINQKKLKEIKEDIRLYGFKAKIIYV